MTTTGVVTATECIVMATKPAVMAAKNVVLATRSIVMVTKRVIMVTNNVVMATKRVVLVTNLIVVATTPSTISPLHEGYAPQTGRRGLCTHCLDYGFTISSDEYRTRLNSIRYR